MTPAPRSKHLNALRSASSEIEIRVRARIRLIRPLGCTTGRGRAGSESEECRMATDFYIPAPRAWCTLSPLPSPAAPPLSVTDLLRGCRGDCWFEHRKRRTSICAICAVWCCRSRSVNVTFLRWRATHGWACYGWLRLDATNTEAPHFFSSFAGQYLLRSKGTMRVWHCQSAQLRPT